MLCEECKILWNQFGGGGAIFVDLLDCLNFAGSWGRNPLTPTKGYMTI